MASAAIDNEADAAQARRHPRCILHDDDVARLVAQHARLRDLCGALERCADTLPDRDAVLAAIGVSTALADELRRHEILETVILGSLFDGEPPLPTHVLLGRIRHRHAVDHLHAEDLRDALAAVVLSTETVGADTLGYMMRCLFDGCRRGIDFQAAAILMLARDRLSPAALTTLSASLDAG